MQEGADPARGTVVDVSGHLRGIAWIYDDSQVFVIPFTGHGAKLTQMLPYPRRDVSLVGRLTPRGLAYLRDRMADALLHNSIPSGWDDVALDGYTHTPAPSESEGWTPISVANGTYWRLPSFARGFS